MRHYSIPNLEKCSPLRSVLQQQIDAIGGWRKQSNRQFKFRVVALASRLVLFRCVWATKWLSRSEIRISPAALLNESAPIRQGVKPNVLDKISVSNQDWIQ
jgi:hypothetical protein